MLSLKCTHSCLRLTFNHCFLFENLFARNATLQNHVIGFSSLLNISSMLTKYETARLSRNATVRPGHTAKGSLTACVGIGSQLMKSFDIRCLCSIKQNHSTNIVLSHQKASQASSGPKSSGSFRRKCEKIITRNPELCFLTIQLSSGSLPPPPPGLHHQKRRWEKQKSTKKTLKSGGGGWWWWWRPKVGTVTAESFFSSFNGQKV